MEITLITFEERNTDPAVVIGHIDHLRLQALLNRDYSNPDESPRAEQKGPGFWWIFFDAKGQPPSTVPMAYARHTGTVAAPSVYWS